MIDPWETSHRWEWFRRKQWDQSFRTSKLKFARMTAEALRELGLRDGALLDCSCGLGMFTIAFADEGLRVHGADGSAFAVACASTLAAEQGYAIPFYVSPWHTLASNVPERFDAIFCDALPSLPTREALLDALQGLRAALAPGGVILFPGVTEGATEERCKEVLQARWRSRSPHAIEWRHTEQGLTCTSLSVGVLEEDGIVRHHLYLIEEGGVQRLESATRFDSFRWSWARLVEAFDEAGFSLSTHAEASWPNSGLPAGLNVARPRPLRPVAGHP